MTQMANQIQPSVNKKIWKIPHACFVFLALLSVLAPGAWAQDNATITGLITDASGALVPNANITVTQDATGQKRETISNSSGTYRFANVGSRHLHNDSGREGISELLEDRHCCKRRCDSGS